jgi:hypothetical protein
LFFIYINPTRFWSLALTKFFIRTKFDMPRW